MTVAALSAHNLGHAYGDVVALHHLDLDVPPGRVGLVDPIAHPDELVHEEHDGDGAGAEDGVELVVFHAAGCCITPRPAGADGA